MTTRFSAGLSLSVRSCPDSFSDFLSFRACYDDSHGATVGNDNDEEAGAVRVNAILLGRQDGAGKRALCILSGEETEGDRSYVETEGDGKGDGSRIES